MAWSNWADKTDEQKKECVRRQKIRRGQDTNTRRAMLAWRKSEKGRDARRRYMDNKGRKIMAERRAKCTAYYERKAARMKHSAAIAENGRSRWTYFEEMKLLEMVNLGMTAPEISIELGRSIRAVEHKREKLFAENSAHGQTLSDSQQSRPCGYVRDNGEKTLNQDKEVA